MIGSAINVMKVDNNFLPLLVDHGVSILRNGESKLCRSWSVIHSNIEHER